MDRDFPLRRLIWLTLLISFCAQLPRGAKFWQEKPYSQWKEKEARQLLEKSPRVEECMVAVNSNPFIARG